MHPEQKKIYQAMRPEQKIKLSLSLYYSARKLKKAAILKNHPDWSEKKVKNEMREIFLYARA